MGGVKIDRWRKWWGKLGSKTVKQIRRKKGEWEKGMKGNKIRKG